MHADHAATETRTTRGVAHHGGVILLIDPLFAGVVGAGDQRLQAIDGINGRHIRIRKRFWGLDLNPWAVVFRRGGGEFRQRQVGFDLAVVHNEEAIFGNGFAHDGKIQIPFLKDGFGFGLKLGFQHHQHALLRFREHHLVGGHIDFALRDLFQIQSHAKATLVAHLHGGAGQTRRAHVLNGDHGTGLHQLQRGFHQAFFGERVADLNGGALFFDGVVKLCRRHGRTTNPVAAGLGTEVHNRHAHTGGGGIEDHVGLHEARRKGVHQTVAVVGGVKAHFAADTRHTKAVAVAADAFDHTVYQLAGLVMRRLAKGQRIHRRDGPRAHGENITQNAANTGGGTLIGLDVGGVVVAFHLEDDRVAITDVHDTGVFAGATDHLRAGGRQGAQPFLR